VPKQSSNAIARNSPTRRWRKLARWAQRKLEALPAAMWVIIISTAVLAVFSVTNIVYQVLRKPAEVFAPISNGFNKLPSETWRHYGRLFREYSTASISPELLAALAQVESAGNPLATTYWRWRFTWKPFSVYEPASSAVGMYQMTDAAYAEAQGYCILNHMVSENGCTSNGLDSRALPTRATELAAVFLERKIEAIVGRRPTATVSAQQKQELAGII
jgi:Transglycosylase SLT domain